MKILLTGARGTLSSSVKERYKCIEIDRVLNSVDHNNLKGIISSDPLEEIYILHFAAETNVDLCETDKLYAINANYVLTKNIIDVIKDSANITLIFISSASIFDGRTDKKYTENDTPNPVNFYAFTKLLSEQYITANLSKYFIFRFGWLIGNPKVDKKFIGKVFQQLVEGNSILKGVIDVFGSLTFADEFATDLNSIFEEKIDYGIYNYVTESNVSRFDLINEIVNSYSLEKAIKVEPTSITNFNLCATRPKYELLSVEKSAKVGLISNLHWKNSLERYLEKYKFIIDGKI